ncbi:agmatinase [Acuticoccus sp.]|uniref:agmatinase n=1 Tax=Acuticoccus sp. TaxID=1904378 RepID=UPI003B52353B
MDEARLAALRERFGGDNARQIHDPGFAAVAERLIDPSGTRRAPFSGVPTLLDAPHRVVDWSAPELSGLDVALVGVPLDLGVTNRNGTRFGPRAVRAVERIGPYHHVLRTMPSADLSVADVGDVPFRSRYDLEGSHEDIERTVRTLATAGVVPLLVGGDHSMTLPVLRALGGERSVGMVHVDAHCDTAGPFDGTPFHHGGPFRQAVLDGVLDPERTVQIGIRGSSEFLWEFSAESGMTVIHAEALGSTPLDEIVATARRVVGDGPTYVSFDVDALDPAFAPGTGTPEVGGLTPREAQAILRGLAGIAIVGADVVEVAPQYDATTNTAQVAAQMLFELFSLVPFAPLRTSR